MLPRNVSIRRVEPKTVHCQQPCLPEHFIIWKEKQWLESEVFGLRQAVEEEKMKGLSYYFKLFSLLVSASTYSTKGALLKAR